MSQRENNWIIRIIGIGFLKHPRGGFVIKPVDAYGWHYKKDAKSNLKLVKTYFQSRNLLLIRRKYALPEQYLPEDMNKLSPEDKVIAENLYANRHEFSSL